MTRRRLLLLTFLVATTLLAWAGPELYRSVLVERFSRALAAAIATAEKTPPHRVAVEKLPAPAWDRLHIFGPYTSTEQIEKRLGFRWIDANTRRNTKSDTGNLLLFVKGRTIAMSLLFPRENGDFTPYAVDARYTPPEALFTVAREGGRLSLRPAAPETAPAPATK